MHKLMKILSHSVKHSFFFSKDTQKEKGTRTNHFNVDVFFCCEQIFLQILGVIAVAASVIPWILIPVVPLLLIFLYLRRYFLRTSRNVKRLESTSECPTVQQCVKEEIHVLLLLFLFHFKTCICNIFKT